MIETVAETKTELLAARAAKKKARLVYEKLGAVSGVGLTRRRGQYAVKVLLESPLDDSADAPADIDGVPVVTQTVGPIKKQTRARPGIKSRKTKITR